MARLLAPELPGRCLAIHFCPDGRPNGNQDSVPDDDIDKLQLTFNPKHVLNGRVIAAAILRAHADWLSGLAKTKSLEHEVYYTLARQWQLEKALETFRGEATGSCVLVSVVATGEESQGDKVDSWESDHKWILDYYKVSDEEVRLPGGMEAAVLSRIATRDI